MSMLCNRLQFERVSAFSSKHFQKGDVRQSIGFTPNDKSVPYLAPFSDAISCAMKLMQVRSVYGYTTLRRRPSINEFS